MPTFLLRLTNEDELNFKFTFIMRQTQTGNVAASTVNGVSTSLPEVTDTVLTGLTFAHASNSKELDNLITREFHANPNLQNNSNVQLVGDYSTEGSPSVQFDWSWKWKSPNPTEDRGGGWRNSCSFLDYDQRTNRLNTLAHFSFWVQNTVRLLPSPQLTSPNLELTIPIRDRVPSGHSARSQSSDLDAGTHPLLSPPTPPETSDNSNTDLVNTTTATTINNNNNDSINTSNDSSSSENQTTNTNTNIPPHPTGPPPPPPVRLDLPSSRPGEDMSAVDDGPLFRATMKALEQKTGNMRTKMKKVLKKAEGAQQAQIACNDAVSAFLGALNEASTSNANAIQPALDHYFEKTARQILRYEQINTIQLQRLVIEPLVKLYHNDIKQAESKKKEFEEESRDYYAYVSRYLGQRQDSLKEKKRVESDSKYQVKRRNFELKRFDYSSFMQDLHGGRKEQEVLSHLTKYADTQAKNFLAAAHIVKDMVPQLDALITEVTKADKEFQFLRTEREEKRRALETSSNTYKEPESVANAGIPTTLSASTNGTGAEPELSRADSTGSQIRNVVSNSSTVSSQTATGVLGAPGAAPMSPTTADANGMSLIQVSFISIHINLFFLVQHRKEGLLWALSRPGSHIDPKGINKQAWHKYVNQYFPRLGYGSNNYFRFWIVLDRGKLSEYSNWKQKLDLHMDPIDLRMASVREARNAERRFCFEVITPQYKRIYQATSEEDMGNWIRAINNALQSAVEGRGMSSPPVPSKNDGTSFGRDIGSVLTGKSSSYSGQHSNSTATFSPVNRRTTVGARPGYVRNDSNNYEEDPAKLLQAVRDADQGNNWCADCGSTSKVEWVSINLGIVLCIECSGIHRSLGTHISKIRSLTLDVHSFSNDIVEILLQVGNRVSNMVWEATLDPSQKPPPTSTREQRLKFISAKYSDRAYVQQLPSPHSRFTTADETLLASIKKHDIKGVLYGIALRANVNVTDRSRNTHAVFLALAAADPASPGSTPSAGVSSSSRPSTAPSVKAIPFPVAELLVQNGAEIPNQAPPIQLSPAAQLYLSQRTSRIATVPAADTVGSLPTIRNEQPGPASHTPSSSLDNSSSNINSNSKERERLHKRGSAGARFAGKVASLGIDR